MGGLLGSCLNFREGSIHTQVQSIWSTEHALDIEDQVTLTLQALHTKREIQTHSFYCKNEELVLFLGLQCLLQADIILKKSWNG